MARRRRRGDSTLQVFIDIVASLPWWAGMLLAGLSWAVLHRMARPPAPRPAGQPAAVQALVLDSVTAGLATAGQYLVPVMCLVAAVLSLLRRRRRQALAADAAAASSAEALNGMSWQAFEQLVGEAFRQQGYRVAERGGAGADGGVDLVLRWHHETFFVQCKQWRALKVGVDVVRQLYGVMAAHGTAGGFVVTSGRYTADAKAFAEGRNITLVDGPQLHRMLRLAREAGPISEVMQPSSAVREDSRPARSPAPSASEPAPDVPACPTCGGAMKVRLARKGRHAGRTFWGCAHYPGCRGVVGMGGEVGKSLPEVTTPS